MKWYPSINGHKQPLVSLEHAADHGAVFGDDIGMTQCGCKIVTVIQTGTALPRNCTSVALHYATYRCLYTEKDGVSRVQIDYFLHAGAPSFTVEGQTNHPL
jgi:hypothetical protein